MRALLATLSVAALLVTAGCMTASVDATVDGDGTVAAYDVELEMTPTVYDTLQSQASDEGYDSVESYLLSDVNTTRMDDYSYEQSIDENVTINVSFVDWSPGPDSDVSTAVEDGNLTYVDRTFVTVQENSSVALGDGVAVEYELTMPGDITSSNADLVRNDTAVWEYGANEPVEEPMRAESPASTSAFGPGFSAVTALVALLAVALLARRANKN
jgi:PGF-CTERM protein